MATMKLQLSTQLALFLDNLALALFTADPRTLLIGTGVMVAATFCLRRVRVWRHERRLTSELQAAGSPNARHNAGGHAASDGELADAN